MIAEVKDLMNQGITADQLKFYGLEYKFLVQHLQSKLSYNDMYPKLNTAIHQFANRQMTWFRRMEKNGAVIPWIDGNMPKEEKLEVILLSLSLKP